MTRYVQSKTRSDEKIFVGLHRHDVIIVGDIFIYFLLDRPIATRYHELHPAITDTKPVQQEIISELQEGQVSLIIRKHIFSNDVLERVKTDFLRNLPNIGATDLDEYIWGNFKLDRTFGPYEVWVRVK
jgi:hypothetical protein